MNSFFARLISYIFHPVSFFLIMPFLVVYRQTESSLYAIKWMIFSAVFIFLGIIIILLEKIRGDFSDLDISKKEERLRFYLILLSIGIIYLGIALLFKGIFFPISFISLGIALGIIFLAFVTPFIKASIHTAVACAFVVSIGILFGKNAFWTVVWIIPVVAWVRVYLKKHTFTEVVAGGLFGTLVTLLTTAIGIRFFKEV